MNLIEDFKSKLLGLYNNQRQAFNQPQHWANIFVDFIENSDGDIESKSWYVYEGSNNPYKKAVFRLKSDSDRVIANLYDGTSLSKVGELVFKFTEGYWIGKDNNFHIPSKNIRIETIIKFDGVNYYSRDAGYELDTNEFLWGKEEHEGTFHFVKQ